MGVYLQGYTAAEFGLDLISAFELPSVIKCLPDLLGSV